MAPGEDTPSPATSATSPTTTQYVALTQPRDPGTFTGENNIDVDKWLSMYERISKQYGWDPTVMLANVIFYLDKTPRVWFETHEHEVTNWDMFKQQLRDLFGNPFGQQLAARKELAVRTQTSTEPYLTYIQEVLALCQKVDHNMSEADKISHILKGIADDAFNLLVFTNVTTIDAVIKECRRLEQAKSRRIPHQFHRLPNTAATSSCEGTPFQPSTTDDVTRIVRRELEAVCPAAHKPTLSETPAPAVALIQAVVRQEFANLGLCSTVCAMNNTDTSVASETTRRRQYPVRSRNPSEWRTADDKPICFRCGRAGHVARYCRSQWPSTPPSQYPAYNSPFRTMNRRYPNRTESSAFAAPEDYGRTFPSSPPPSRSSRSPTRRRSPSPSFSRRMSPEN